MNTFTIPTSLTSAHWIHDDAKLVDLDFKVYNKQQILNRIEAWKNFFRQRNIKNLMLADYTNLNSVSIFFACLELSIPIYTKPTRVRPSTSELDLVDVVILGASYRDLHDPNHSKFLLIDYKTLSDSTVEYQPTVMDPDFKAIHATKPFTAIPYQHDIKTLYWSTVGSDDCFKFNGKKHSAYPQINHVALIPSAVTGPLYGGATTYAIDHFYEMIMLVSRGVVDVITVFSTQLSDYIEFEKNQNIVQKNYKVELNNVEIQTGGTRISTVLADWVFSRGGKRIRHVYGHNDIMVPIFVQDIESPDYDFRSKNIGQPNPFLNVRIDENSRLWIKNEIGAHSMQPTEDSWFKLPDFVVEKDGQYILKGPTRVGDKFLTDYEDIAFDAVNDGTVNFGEFVLTYDNNSNTINVNAFSFVLYDKFCSVQSTLINNMRAFGDISNVTINYLDPEKGKKGTHG